ncbi:MAG: FAD-dependent oxidoreductase [archaeon]
MYDLIIVGAGPAGMTAAIYAARRKIDFLIIGLEVGGQMAWSSDVENYPGLHFMSGLEMTQRFQHHLNDYKVKINQEEVVGVKKKGKVVFVITKKNTYGCKAVIVACGKSPKKLNVPGEDKYLGKGVNYCAVCDAPLFKNKTVAVVGGGNSGLDSADFLAKYANKVYIINLAKKLTGEPYLRGKVESNKKIVVINNAEPTEILGDKFVSGIKFTKEGREQTLKLDSIFVEVGLVTKTDFLKEVKKNRWGEIMIFRSTKTHEENMTSVKGIFAAGDVTDIPSKQIAAAVGEGCKAAMAAFDYIDRWKK